jgi:hypothetical protein
VCKASSKRELSLTLSQAATTLCSEREREEPEASGVMKQGGIIKHALSTASLQTHTTQVVRHDSFMARLYIRSRHMSCRHISYNYETIRVYSLFNHDLAR